MIIDTKWQECDLWNQVKKGIYRSYRLKLTTKIHSILTQIDLFAGLGLQWDM